ncbi:hypothetical protein UMM65_17075 [Aureibaculum sp. 2210JD6-5]|uniref:hypothetical protein n=1 Tax=Aureibaculum sp. 2210JD6-5 TaxID=3103957 RepID=UPI002AAEDDE2|nr:hypothetical protein [Aureibaculum sp. 2210JD6-5]MDY7396962.1 hypothetical protein [Aureibaculum sp. 2210JD6-5]
MDFKKTNPAVIKTMFSQMDKKTFIKNMQLLKEELSNVEVTYRNRNYRLSLLNLYRWGVNFYLNKFKK